jgi:hypothetical protein
MVVVGALMAQDDRGNVNDPGFNERANACFAGGSLEGKCHTTDADFDGDIDDLDIEYMWWCGWYKIRVEFRHIPRSAAPEGCQPLLAPLSVPSGAPAAGGGSVSPACDLPPSAIVFYFGGGPDNPAWSLLVNFFNSDAYDDSGDPVLLFESRGDKCPIRFIALDQWNNFIADYDGRPM